MNKSDMFFSFVMGCVAMLMMVLTMLEVFKENTAIYKQGQIDVMNGKVLFELKKAADGSTQWARIEK